MADATTKDKPEVADRPAPAPQTVPPTMMRLVAQSWVGGIQVGGPSGITITQDPTPVDAALVPAVHAFVNELQNSVPSFAVGGFYVVEEPDAPAITSLVPATAASGGASPTAVQVMGTGFLQGDVVAANGYQVTTTYVSDTELDFSAYPPSVPTDYSIQVIRDGGVSSNVMTFSYT